MTGYTLLCFAFVVTSGVYLADGQLPSRLQIPGALLIPRPPQQRLLRPSQPASDANQNPPAKLRKPFPNVFPVAIPIREEAEEINGGLSLLDEDSSKLNVSPVIQQTRDENDNDEEPIPRPIQFRPERPLAIPRHEIPTPLPRAVLRQNLGDEPPRQPLSQPRRVPSQPIRQNIKPQPRPPASDYSNVDDSRRTKNRKPPVQILRKYRTDNEDGSITWGFENEDGTFKEETIGTDCTIRGKYGYIDPEGTKREYVYETGNKCDHPQEEEPAEETPNVPNRPNNIPKKPLIRGSL